MGLISSDNVSAFKTALNRLTATRASNLDGLTAARSAGLDNLARLTSKAVPTQFQSNGTSGGLYVHNQTTAWGLWFQDFASANFDTTMLIIYGFIGSNYNSKSIIEIGTGAAPNEIAKISFRPVPYGQFFWNVLPFAVPSGSRIASRNRYFNADGRMNMILCG